MHTGKEFMKLAEDFRICRPVLVALGDEKARVVATAMGYEYS